LCLLSKNFKIKVFRTIILPVVLYGYETWPLTIREKHRLRVLESRVLRTIFCSKKEEVAGGWRRLHNDEHHNLYASPNIIRVIIIKEDEIGRSCSMHGRDVKCI
jgi:hypothetical protein